MFGITKFEKLPTEYLTDYILWDEYMSAVWVSLLKKSNYHAQMTIVEIACGSSLKIAKALMQLNFSGVLYLVDPCTATLSSTLAQCKTLVPHAQIIPVAQTLLASIPLLPKTTDLIVSNHPIDDMIIGYLAKHEESVFNWELNAPGILSKQLLYHWSEFAKDKKSLPKITQKIIKAWQQVLNSLNYARLIISQYPSAVLRNQGLDDLNHYAALIFAELKPTVSSLNDHEIQNCLNQFENFNDKHIGLEVLNAKNWLLTSGET
ncbi:MAG: hypothetical protein WC627_01270 [Legionella sp.]|jgi:hypothetical protein